MAGLLAGTLARYAPGFEADEEQWDPGRSEESRARLRAAREADRNLFIFYPRFLFGLLRGDWGQSRSLQRPVRDLVAERAGLTAAALGGGLGLGLSGALLAALLATRYRKGLFAPAGAALSTLGLCLPAGLCAFLLLEAGANGIAALIASIGVMVFAKLFPYFRNLLEDVRRAPAVTLARAKGAGEWTVLFRHVLRPSAPRVLALTSVGASVALSACVPLEMILDEPGIGQLAWQAAIARDLPLLVVITWVLAAFLMLLSAVADGTGDGLSRA
jgi:peptide/nickel transport system permease protein